MHVLFLDLDHFKEINDTLSHAAGDDLLRQVARQLAKAVREEACLARLGGDEFAVLLENASDDSAGRLAQRMLAAIMRPFHVRARQVHIGVSIGIARGQHPIGAGDLLHHADIAMYRSKRSGGERITVFRDVRQ